jgi:hypothetical protein
MQSGKVKTAAQEGTPEPFAVRLDLDGAFGEEVNMVTQGRSILVGLLAAFQSHDGSHLDELAGLLARELGRDPSWTADMLVDDGSAILGRRAVASPFGEGIRWNPPLDACMVVDLSVGRIDTGDAITLNGEVLAVTER